MRTFLIACLLVVISVPLAAADQWPVVVTTDTGEKIRGRLLAITPERLTLSSDGKLRPIRLDEIVRVVKPRDSVLDGFLKGVVVGLIPLLIYGEEIDGSFGARFVLSYGLIGMGIDAVQGERIVLYDRRTGAGPPAAAAAAIGWKIRF